MFNDRFLLLTFFAALLIYGVAALCLFLTGKLDSLPEVSLSLLASYMMMVVSYLTSRNAFVKSTEQFYRLIFGGMAVRFLFFIGILFFIYKFTTLSLSEFILSFVVFYVIFQSFEIRFLVKQMKNQKHV